LILAMSVSVWATLLAVDAPLQSADSPRVATGEPTGTRDIEEARATTPPLLRPRESSARQLPATTPVVYGQRGGTAFPDAFLRREASSGRPQGPASIGRVEYVLPQLRPLPSQTQPQGRPLPAGTHVDENGYVIF
jgi:hypothetical protein